VRLRTLPGVSLPPVCFKLRTDHSRLLIFSAGNAGLAPPR
jgi:hypothetical protein